MPTGDSVICKINRAPYLGGGRARGRDRHAGACGARLNAANLWPINRTNENSVSIKFLKSINLDTEFGTQNGARLFDSARKCDVPARTLIHKRRPILGTRLQSVRPDVFWKYKNGQV
jgi:hypothetical protein